MEFSRQEYWSGLPFLQEIFLTQGWNPGLLHCRQILHRLSRQGGFWIFFTERLSHYLASLSSVQFSHSVVSDSLQPHGLQHARPPSPLTTPGVYSNSCPLSRWCHPTISSSVIPFFLPSIFPSIRVFSNESVLRIRWPKYWSFSFSISPSNEYSGLISLWEILPWDPLSELILPIYIHLLEGFKITLFPSLDLLFEWALQFSCWSIFCFFTIPWSLFFIFWCEPFLKSLLSLL